MTLRALFADTHIHPYARFSSVSPSGLNSWVEETLAVMEVMYTQCVERGVSEVWFLGDLFHAGGRIQTEVYNSVLRFFERWRGQILTTLIAGNHDLGNLNECAFLSLGNVVEAVIIGEPQIRELPDVCVLFVPFNWVAYGSHYKKLSQWVARLITTGRGKACIVAGHVPVSGAVVGRVGHVLDQGCSPGTFRHVDRAFLGHFHGRQQLGANVEYIGSLVSRNFAEVEVSGYTLYDTETKEEEFVPLESTGFRVLVVPSDYCGEEVLPGSESVSVRNCIVRVDYEDVLTHGETEVRESLMSKGAVRVVFNRMSARTTEVRVTVSPDGLPPSLNDYLDAYVAKECGTLDGGRLRQAATSIIQETERVAKG